MRKAIIGAAVAAMALGGAAVAFGDESSKKIPTERPTIAIAAGPPMFFGAGPDDGFAEDLAAELGVSAEEVKDALEAVAEKQMSERRHELAEAITERLDGVSVEQVESALETAEQKMREAFENGDPPAPDLFNQTLADELGLEESEIEDAMRGARVATLEEHRDELRGHDEIGPGIPPPPEAMGFALPAVPR